MLVLDTDHLSEWESGSAAGSRLRIRLQSADADMAITIITVEGQIRGWLAEIHRRNDLHRQIAPYAKLQRQIEAFAEWLVLPWDSEAADLFLSLRKQGLRIGTMDLKIACIAITHDAMLLTRNTSDFNSIARLRTENWLD